jgi:hypothetical protein
MRMILTSGLVSKNQPKIPHAAAAITAAELRSVKVSDTIRVPLFLALPISLLKMIAIPKPVSDKNVRYHEIP